MSILCNLLFITSILLVIDSVVLGSPASPKAISKRENDDSEGDSPKEETDEKDLGTESPEEEKEDEGNLSEVEVTTDVGELNSNARLAALLEKIKSEGPENEEDIEQKSPAEMEEMKEELYKLMNEFGEKMNLPKISREEFDEEWDVEKERYGKLFPLMIEGSILLLKTAEEEEVEEITPVKEVSDSITEVSVLTTETSKEEAPRDTFIVQTKGKICIIAKFDSAITIYTGNEPEQKVEVSIPPNAIAQGKCSGPNRSPSMEISWGKFIFTLHFNKTSEDTWGATSVELIYDTSEPIFDGTVDHGKVTASSKKVILFETPFGKSYFCPAKEVILLYSENQHVATVRLKDVHLQPYDVEDGKLSASHRCNQVVIGGPDEEPFVQDETIPLAVGCTLALITLLILVGFSVHRAYNAAKVDYNTME